MMEDDYAYAGQLGQISETLDKIADLLSAIVKHIEIETGKGVKVNTVRGGGKREN